MRKLTLLAVLFAVTAANAGVARFSAKHVVKPAAKASYKASVKAARKSAHVAKKLLY